MLGKKGRVVFLTGRWYPNAHHTLGKTVENTPWEIRLRLSFLYWEDIILQLYINSKFVSDFYYFFEPVQFFFFFFCLIQTKNAVFLSLEQAQTEIAFIARYHYRCLVMILWRRVLESCHPVSFSCITTIVVNIQSSWTF